MFNGFEIDMVSLGDADCLIVTEWNPQWGMGRILIDGGSRSDAKVVKSFLLERGYKYFYSVVCTHAHNDHAAGLIELVKDPAFTFSNGWMHDIRNHVDSASLRKASAGNSSQADGVRQIVETTKELDSAFRSRGVIPQEPFLGAAISGYPQLVVLGPSLAFYKSVLADFTKVEVPSYLPPLLAAAVPAAGSTLPSSLPPFLRSALLQPAAKFPLSAPVPLAGLLGGSSVKDSPTTQPFNDTSVILGGIFQGHRVLLTADAGSKALDRVSPDWKSLSWMQVPHHGSVGNLSQTNIERFHPQNAYISACGDSSHPNRAIVSGLVKAGAKVFSTHQSGNLCFHIGSVPYRPNYSPAIPLKGTGNPQPFDWLSLIPGAKG